MANTLEIRQQDARAIARGHPWVYRQALIGRARNYKAGDVVELSSQTRPFLGRGIVEPGASVIVRVWTRERDRPIDVALLTDRLRAAAAQRDELGIAATTDAFRLVNAEGDGLPGLVVDRYGEWLSVEIQSPALRPWRDRIAQAVQAAFAPRGAHWRDEGRTTLLCGEPCPNDLVVSEPTGKFRVRVPDDGKTGLFTDMRDVRVLLASLARGRSFLNLFAHTGAFSAAAAGAGASEVLSVDLSRAYLEAAQDNVRLTAPDYQDHRIHAGDAFETLTALAQDRKTFDIVLCDPPSFSTSRKGGQFSIEARYGELVRAALRVLTPEGRLICATNFRGIDEARFLHLLHDGADAHGTVLCVERLLRQPADYPVLPLLPETAYLQVALCRARPALR